MWVLFCVIGSVQVARQLANLRDAPLVSRQLASGSFVADLLAALTAAPPLRLALFSELFLILLCFLSFFLFLCAGAHDDTLRALLWALYANETQISAWPAYASVRAARDSLFLSHRFFFFFSLLQHIALELWTNTTDASEVFLICSFFCVCF